MIDVVVNSYIFVLTIVLCMSFVNPIVSVIAVVGVLLSNLFLQLLGRKSQRNAPVWPLPECFPDGRGTGGLAGQLSHGMGPVHRKAVRVHGFYRQAVSEPCRYHPALGQRGCQESSPAHPQPGLQRKGG